MPAPWQPPDLDEIRPDHFVVNNEKVGPFLRGAGQREGVFFHLQDWRREGWVARLRMAGFNVRTIRDRVESLRAAPRDLELGPEGIRPLTGGRERIATWDRDRLRWTDLQPETVGGVSAVRLRANEPLRRRKSRGGGDYFIAIAEKTGGVGFRPVKEIEAILHAYGLLVSSGHPAILRFIETPAGHLVPHDQALLPEPHREALDRLALDDHAPWTFGPDQLELAEQVFGKLGVELAREPR